MFQARLPGCYDALVQPYHFTPTLLLISSPSSPTHGSPIHLSLLCCSLNSLDEEEEEEEAAAAEEEADGKHKRER